MGPKVVMNMFPTPLHHHQPKLLTQGGVMLLWANVEETNRPGSIYPNFCLVLVSLCQLLPQFPVLS